ncbi:hypothetical protein ACSBR2_001660 [Camellia fascicularis]
MYIFSLLLLLLLLSLPFLLSPLLSDHFPAKSPPASCRSSTGKSHPPPSELSKDIFNWKS